MRSPSGASPELRAGNSSVGKSSLLLRFTDQQWLPEDESSATIGVDFRVRVLRVARQAPHDRMQVCKMEVKGKKVKLSIWVRRSLRAASMFVLTLAGLGHRRPGAFPDDHELVLPWRARHIPRCAPVHVCAVFRSLTRRYSL